MPAVISHSPAETEALGHAWGQAAQRGLVVALSGPLGAGKTQLVRGLARGLGITARIHSPTFNLVNIYPGGRLSLCHLDLFRLESSDQIAAAGLEEYLQPDGVTVVEWAERWFGKEPFDPSAGHQPYATRLIAAQIEILTETERRISYEDSGS
jgi:tRNA threonylcarbamoyladenosine biosynthesis protein TsaE